jgi:hypothetical protein
MYLIYLSVPKLWYARVYFVTELPYFALDLGVIWEIARIVMRPTGTWIRDAKRQFILWGSAGVLLAAALSWSATPPTSDLYDCLKLRIDLFLCALMSELVIVLMLTSNHLGLGWRNHVMAIGNGWGAIAVFDIVIEGLHSYFGVHRYYLVLEHAQIVAYLIVLGYWMVQFWREEPARKPLPPELSAYIEALHKRVKNNLDTLETQR